MQEQRLFGREALFEVVALEQTGDAQLRRDFDQPREFEPFIHSLLKRTSVISRIEDLEDLVAVGFGVALDLLARQRLAGLGSSGGIADHRGEIADEENYGVSRVLKVAQFLERQAVAEMQVGRGRIHPELDPERPAERNFGRELRRRNNFDGAAGERRRLFIRLIFLHVPLGQFRSLEFQWLSSVQEF